MAFARSQYFFENLPGPIFCKSNSCEDSLFNRRWWRRTFNGQPRCFFALLGFAFLLYLLGFLFFFFPHKDTQNRDCCKLNSRMAQRFAAPSHLKIRWTMSHWKSRNLLEGIIKLVNRPNRKDKWHLKHPETKILDNLCSRWLELLFFAFFCFFSSFSFFFCASWPNSTAKKTGSKSSNNIWREKRIKVEKSRISKKKKNRRRSIMINWQRRKIVWVSVKLCSQNPTVDQPCWLDYHSK